VRTTATGEVVVEVRDTGVGIPAEHMPHIFERFYRVDKSRSRALGGSGIGLTVARAAVEAMGGRIWAESEGDGRGAAFRFSLPTAGG
jgi:signal transduction histidine kinase